MLLPAQAPELASFLEDLACKLDSPPKKAGLMTISMFPVVWLHFNRLTGPDSALLSHRPRQYLDHFSQVSWPSCRHRTNQSPLRSCPGVTFEEVLEKEACSHYHHISASAREVLMPSNQEPLLPDNLEPQLHSAREVPVFSSHGPCWCSVCSCVGVLANLLPVPVCPTPFPKL